MENISQTKLKITPKDFFLWVGAMLSLYVSVFAFLALFFGIIDYAYPDVLSPFRDVGGIQNNIALLVVLFPLYAVLMWLIRRDIVREPMKKELWVRRWALVFTIFVAGATVAIDLVTLLNRFLAGDLTTSFVLKTVVVLLIAGAFFLHFLADMWNFWETHTAQSRVMTALALFAVVAIIATSFSIIGLPWQARMYRLDAQKTADLQNISWQVVNYYQAKQKLPTTLADLNDSVSGYRVPTDPQSAAEYDYVASNKLSFRVCAHFNAPTQVMYLNYVSTPYPISVSGAADQGAWYHRAGYDCLYQTIDPEKYPAVGNKNL